VAMHNRPRGRSTSEEAEQPGRRHGSRSEERSRVAEPERSRGGDRPPAAGHEARVERGRDHSDGRRDGKEAGSRDRERADSRGAAAERIDNGYREGRREDRDRDGRRDDRRRDSRERGRDAKRDSRDQSRDRDRAEYEHKRSRPPPAADPGTAPPRTSACFVSLTAGLCWRLAQPILGSRCSAAADETRSLGVLPRREAWLDGYGGSCCTPGHAQSAGRSQ
jgi:hypothetical protein